VEHFECGGGPIPPAALAVLGLWTFSVAVLIMGALQEVPPAMALGAGLVLVSCALVARRTGGRPGPDSPGPSPGYARTEAASPRATGAAGTAWTDTAEPPSTGMTEPPPSPRHRRLVEALERMAAGSPFPEERRAFQRKAEAWRREHP
jgi:hypothetical protein